MATSADPLLGTRSKPTQERVRPDLYLWSTGNTLGTLGCTTVGVYLGIKNGFKDLPIWLFAMAGICGFNAAKGWFDVNRERVRILTQSGKEEVFLRALGAVAGSLEARRGINDADGPVFADERARSFWTRIQRALPGLFALPVPAGPTEEEIQARIDAAVDRALQSIIGQLTPLFPPGKKFSGTTKVEVLNSILTEVITEVQKPKLRNEGVELADARTQLASAEDALAEKTALFTAAEERCTALEEELRAEKAREASIQSEYDSSQERVRELEGLLSEKGTASEASIASLQDELRVEKGKVSSLEAQKLADQTTLERLTQELAQLTATKESFESRVGELTSQLKAKAKAFRIAKKTNAETEQWSSQLFPEIGKAIRRLRNPDASSEALETFVLPPPTHPLYSLVEKVNDLIEHANSVVFETDDSVDLDSSFTPGSSPPLRGIRVSFGAPMSPGARKLADAFGLLDDDSEDE